MAYAESILEKILTTDQDVNDLIGGRYYPQVAPQESGFPRITVQLVGQQDTQDNSGSHNPVKADLQLDVWGLKYEDVKKVALAIHNAKGGQDVKPFHGLDKFATVDGFKGTVGDVVVQGIFIQEEKSLYEPPIHSTEIGLHRIMMPITMWFNG